MKNNKKFYPFSNAVMFSLVMQDEKICIKFLEMLFPGKKIKGIKYNEECCVSTEKTIIPNLESKSIRLDVMFENESSVYDIEMQVSYEKNLPERTRYYHACSTVDTFERGQSYRDMKDSFVIFVCLYDAFSLGKPVYSFESYDVKNNLKLHDRAYTMILNTDCEEEFTPDSLKDFFSYVSKGEVHENNNLVNAIHKQVERLNSDEGVREIMTLEEEYRIRNAEAREDGLAEGLEKGLKKSQLEIAKKMLAAGEAIEKIEEYTGLSEKDVKNLQKD